MELVVRDVLEVRKVHGLLDADVVAAWSIAIAGLWILVVNFGMATPSNVNAMVVGLLVIGVGTANAVYCHRPARTGA